MVATFTKQRAATLTLAAAALAVTGCKVGPNYEPPQELPTATWSQAAKGPVTSEPPDLNEWWKDFKDPILDQLIAQAEQSNATIEKTLANVRIGLAILGVTESQYWPKLRAGFAYSRNETNVSLVPSAGVESSPYSVWAAGVAMSNWEIDVWGRIARTVESSTASLQASVEDLRDALVSVRAQVGTTYMKVRTLQLQLAILTTGIANYRTILDQTRAKYDAGTASLLELNEAQMDLDEIEASIPQVESDLAASIFSIAQLCGTTPQPMMTLLGPTAPLPVAPDAVGVGIPADLLRRRPDVRSSERLVAAAVANIGANEALNFPVFSLSGNFYLAANQFGSIGNSGTTAYGFGPSISWLIFQGGYVDSLIAQSKGQAQVALAVYRDTVLNAVRDVETSISTLVQEKRSVEYYTQAVASAGSTFKLAEQQYQAGTITLDRLTSIQNSLLEMQSDLAKSQGAVASGFVSLYRALGGGWDDGAVDREVAEAAGGKEQS
ncbi:MAG: efflux transporter outer membrane subunit [Phycisphaerales bacterium]|nr:efflux transporter outer membrane subunit [Phycisphaerales bacterium]